jgi:hypothetical protein
MLSAPVLLWVLLLRIAAKPPRPGRQAVRGARGFTGNRAPIRACKRLLNLYSIFRAAATPNEGSKPVPATNPTAPEPGDGQPRPHHRPVGASGEQLRSAPLFLHGKNKKILYEIWIKE